MRGCARLLLTTTWLLGLASPAGAAVLTVGLNMQYATLGDALNAAQANDTIDILAGVYTGDNEGFVNVPLTIQGVGGMAIFDDSCCSLQNRKGVLVSNANLTVNDIGFVGASIPDNAGENGAGIRVQGGQLTVENSLFESDQDGILGNSDPGISITVIDSMFLANGACDGFTHGLYAAGGAALTVIGSTFADTCVGHDIQSRAAMTTIEDNSFDECSPASTTSYEVNIANGGVGTVEGNSFCKGPNAQNQSFISYDPGGYRYAQNSLTVEDNSFIGSSALFDPPPPLPVGINGPSIVVHNFSSVANPSAPVTAVIADNVVQCVNEVAVGPAILSNNTVVGCPEPGTLVIAAPLGLLLWLKRRRVRSACPLSLRGAP